jgi:glutamine amidotransferase
MKESGTFRVAIIDYQMGNMFSVQHACGHAGLSSFITSDREKIRKADGAILPGVGAFGEAMENLKKLDLIDVIKGFISSGKPFMGVCLGLQLLFSESEEFGLSRGLDIISGEVLKFPVSGHDGTKLKVPQIGWNQIHSPHDRDDEFWRGSPLQKTVSGAYMYFVHSYYAVPDSSSVILSTTHYGNIDYCSSLLIDNVFATQFHPEKSAEEGIAIYKQWADISQKGKEN